MKPALTPEEWRWLREPQDKAPLAPSRGDQKLDIALYSLGAIISPDDYACRRHALAALALHGQPFGFRHEDVRRLREAIVPEKWEPRADEDETDALHTIADRIEALLPPEEKAVGFSDFPVVNGREVQPGEVFDVYESRWPPEEK